MKLTTDQPVFLHREEITNKIAIFWDKISLAWRQIWGPHIHHGYYVDQVDIKPLEAQEKLIEKLAQMLEIAPNARILDVGCGMGGSSIYLADKYHANVTGITLSQVQRDIAEKQAQASNSSKVNFMIEDALNLKSFADNSIDIVWALESCEQFFDKNLFLQQASRVLKPGGKLMLVTWCSSESEYEGKQAKQYQQLCFAFDVPYMPTIDYYTRLLTKNNFRIKNSLDWSSFVKKSWDVGISLVNAYSFFKLLRLSGWRGFIFSKQIKLMQRAFLEKRIQYAVFLAEKE